MDRELTFVAVEHGVSNTMEYERGYSCMRHREKVEARGAHTRAGDEVT